MKLFTCITVGILLLPFYIAKSVAAMEGGHAIAAIALAAKQQNVTPVQPWVSTLRITDNDHTLIRLADGAGLMRRPERASSYNDDNYDVSRFYKPDSVRVNTVWHYAGRKAGEIFSVGVDSGYHAKKITIRPALFIGYARSVEVGQGKYLTFAAGGWFGGRVTHKACRDEYDRKYYCGTLRAWSDFRPQRDELQHYYRFVYRHEF